jgi:hypothetical protein
MGSASGWLDCMHYVQEGRSRYQHDAGEAGEADAERIRSEGACELSHSTTAGIQTSATTKITCKVRFCLALSVRAAAFVLDMKP